MADPLAATLVPRVLDIPSDTAAAAAGPSPAPTTPSTPLQLRLHTPPAPAPVSSIFPTRTSTTRSLPPPSAGETTHRLLAHAHANTRTTAAALQTPRGLFRPNQASRDYGTPTPAGIKAAILPTPGAIKDTIKTDATNATTPATTLPRAKRNPMHDNALYDSRNTVFGEGEGVVRRKSALIKAFAQQVEGDGGSTKSERRVRFADVVEVVGEKETDAQQPPAPEPLASPGLLSGKGLHPSFVASRGPDSDISSDTDDEPPAPQLPPPPTSAAAQEPVPDLGLFATYAGPLLEHSPQHIPIVPRRLSVRRPAQQQQQQHHLGHLGRQAKTKQRAVPKAAAGMRGPVEVGWRRRTRRDSWSTRGCDTGVEEGSEATRALAVGELRMGSFGHGGDEEEEGEGEVTVLLETTSDELVKLEPYLELQSGGVHEATKGVAGDPTASPPSPATPGLSVSSTPPATPSPPSPLSHPSPGPALLPTSAVWPLPAPSPPSPPSRPHSPDSPSSLSPALPSHPDSPPSPPSPQPRWTRRTAVAALLPELRALSLHRLRSLEGVLAFCDDVEDALATEELAAEELATHYFEHVHEVAGEGVDWSGVLRRVRGLLERLVLEEEGGAVV